jgi:hypothetical protein
LILIIFCSGSQKENNRTGEEDHHQEAEEGFRYEKGSCSEEGEGSSEEGEGYDQEGEGFQGGSARRTHGGRTCSC